MKIATSTALASSSVLALLSATSSAFTVGGRQAGSNGFFLSSTATALHATVETSTYAKLVPPPSIQEATEHAQELYDTNVQKTYGYVPRCF
jgi:hypothetical protein